MARPQEPAWLTAIYSVVGLIVIALAVAAAFLVAAFWPLFVLLGIGAAVFWWMTKSPAALEQQARDRAATLLRELAAIDMDRFPSARNFSIDIVAALIDGDEDAPKPPQQLMYFIGEAAEELYAAEQFTLTSVREPPPLLNTIEGARYLEHLQHQYQKLSDLSGFDTFREATHTAFKEFIDALPPALLQPRRTLLAEIDGQASVTTFSIPLMQLLADPGHRVEELILSFYGEAVRSRKLFAELRDQLDRNQHTASGVPFTGEPSDKLILPTEYQGDDLVSAFLSHTPLQQILTASVPFTIPEPIRFEHTHILAGSGHGKTQTLQHLILADLSRPDPPSLVIVDSQGDMLRKLSRLALFEPTGALADRLIIIDPSDVDYPPALNMFDVNFDRIGQYNAAAREQILNGVIELYDYIFGSLLGAELTQKQSVIFRYIARLVLTIPGATIHTLIELMTDATPFLGNIAQLPPGARMFFETEFPHKSFVETKRQIQRRLWGILENPTFERMLSAPTNRIDMFDALNRGKIVLVNTAKDFLKAERSSFLGRLFIALTLQAALERAALPEHQRRPTFLYIDEAADYFDLNIDDLLTQARKYNLGVVFSHQYLDQLAPGLRSSIASNTSIKLAGGVSERDARSIAPDMRTTPTFILAQHKEAHGTQFACHVRNYSSTALSLRIPFGTLERQTTMTEAAYQQLLARNRAQISATTGPIVEVSTPDSPTKPQDRSPARAKPPQRAISFAGDAGDNWES